MNIGNKLFDFMLVTMLHLWKILNEFYSFVSMHLLNLCGVSSTCCFIFVRYE